jgi:release factor glutamine methyltransferase
MKKNQATVGYLFRRYKEILLTVYDNRESESLLYILFEEYARLSRVKLMAEPGLVIDADIQSSIEKAINLLMERVPVQYIIGRAQFYGMEFFVNEHVLIPRPETEELVEWIIHNLSLEKERIESHEPLKILDIGTGSGCIAITLKKHLPDIHVTGTDIFSMILSTARKNARHNTVKVTFINHNILMWDHLNNLGMFDVVVSNPPYITLAEQKFMKKNVLHYEPWLSLFVDDSHPLIFYDAIAGFARQHLNRAGRIFLEINESKGKDVVDLLKGYSYNDIELRKDLNGKDRMVCAAE